MLEIFPEPIRNLLQADIPFFNEKDRYKVK
jgi:hypothetical protein